MLSIFFIFALQFYIFCYFYWLRDISIFSMRRLEAISEKIKSDKTQYIYSVPSTPKVKGETPIYRKPTYKDGLIKIPSEIQNLSDFWNRSLKKYENNLLIQDLTYKQVDQITERVGAWIKSRGHNLFFLYCLNSPSWTLTDIASWKYGFINVPLYDTLGAEAFYHILKITEGTLMFTTQNLLNNLISFLSKDKYNLKQVCFFDEISSDEQKKLEALGVKVSFFKEALKFSKTLPKPKLNLDSELTYAFTSGTTGIPKGVIYTHRMAISQSYGLVGHYQVNQTDIHMSYLPIAHAFERCTTWFLIFYGANIRYAKHPIAEILKDFAAIRPTAIPIVPRLLNKFYPILKGLYEKQGNYDKVRAIFGGRIRIIVTGSAPVAPAILNFFKEALGGDIRQGFGQTQTTAASFITYKGDTNYGHVGGPNSATQFKLVDVPEMNYFTNTEPPRGQICMRGESVFKKYFKDPKNSQETVDADGWNHTGDIGIILPNGALKIIDRKKNIFKLQQGEYVAPQKIENIYARCRYVAESFLYGDSLKEYNIAIIHPNLEHLPSVAKQLGIQETEVKKLCQNQKVTEFIYQQLTKQAKQDGLLGFEHAKKIKLWHQPFNVVGIVTSTMKLQRHLAKQKFIKQIQELYQ